MTKSMFCSAVTGLSHGQNTFVEKRIMFKVELKWRLLNLNEEAENEAKHGNRNICYAFSPSLLSFSLLWHLLLCYQGTLMIKTGGRIPQEKGVCVCHVCSCSYYDQHSKLGVYHYTNQLMQMAAIFLHCHFSCCSAVKMLPQCCFPWGQNPKWREVHNLCS